MGIDCINLFIYFPYVFILKAITVMYFFLTYEEQNSFICLIVKKNKQDPLPITPTID